jgi:hypothetical protein
MASSSTSVVELEPIHSTTISFKADGVVHPVKSPLTGRPLGTANGHPDSVDDLPRPGTATSVVQRWNYPRSNVPKVAACFWSFVVMGANDAAYGVSFSAPERWDVSRVWGPRKWQTD